jgi:DNA-binding response OmpR family regulator
VTPLKVLVVEDEVAIAILIEDAVGSFGHVVSHTATNIKDAMAVAMTGDFDVALLDLNLNGQKAHAIPVTLAARGKPFGFITGYGDVGVLTPFANAPVIAKPFRIKNIGEMLEVLQKRIKASDA